VRACVREVYKMSWNQRSLKVHLHDRQKSQNLRFVRLQTCVSCCKCFHKVVQVLSFFIQININYFFMAIASSHEIKFEIRIN